jgi:hypothetical protein
MFKECNLGGEIYSLEKTLDIIIDEERQMERIPDFVHPHNRKVINLQMEEVCRILEIYELEQEAGKPPKQTRRRM